MNLTEIEYHDEIAVLKMVRGVTNAINLNFVDSLTASLQEVLHNGNAGGLVLCSGNMKFFSIGFDIPELIRLDESNIRIFLRKFDSLCLDLFACALPTIAAITGHAIAGGCILSLCCDYRYISEGRKLVGLNEVKLGVPLPWPADCILRHLVGMRESRLITETGDFYEPASACRIGLVDRVIGIEEVLPAAVETIRKIGFSPRNGLARIKHNRVSGIVKEIRERLQMEEDKFLECWFSKESRARLNAATEKF
jgi:enoyl-CoA hydratase/carnithine racemase